MTHSRMILKTEIQTPKFKNWSLSFLPELGFVLPTGFCQICDV
jgi:hypothetical protein